jgi:hypothetical protein
MKRPQAEEFPLFYKGYIDTVCDDVLTELEQQSHSFPDLLRDVPQAKASFAYAEGKWTIQELAGHVIDTERIMAYRALRITRNDYVSNAHFGERSLESLADEFASLRKANMYLIRSLKDIEIDRSGISNEKPISVRALIFIMAGHVNHHVAILKQRYL